MLQYLFFFVIFLLIDKSKNFQFYKLFIFSVTQIREKTQRDTQRLIAVSLWRYYYIAPAASIPRKI